MSTYQVRSLDEADQIIKEHERKTKTVYALLRSTKNFGCYDAPACSNIENEVRFETVGVPYCGVPFFVAGLKILQCQSLKGKVGRRKKEIKMEKPDICNGLGGPDHEEEDATLPRSVTPKKKKKGNPTRQGLCTATVIMKEVIYYPDFQLLEHSKNNRIAVARQLKESLKSKTAVQKDRIIYVTVPALDDHFGHPVGNSNSKRVYVKNYFYGCNEPGSSKRVYYPVKQEKVKVVQLAKKLKVEGGEQADEHDDAQATAKEVRDTLQAIMSLTYKPGTASAFKDLLKDLSDAKARYQQQLARNLHLEHPIHVIATPVVTSPAALGVIATPFSAQHQVLVQTAAMAKSSIEMSVCSPSWTTTTTRPPSGGAVLASTGVLPATAAVVAVSGVPVAVSASSSNGTPTGQADPSQESNIFIEAMEAIFNSQHI